MTKKQLNAAIRLLGAQLEKGKITLFEYNEQKDALEQQIQDLETKRNDSSTEPLEGFEYTSLY